MYGIVNDVILFYALYFFKDARTQSYSMAIYILVYLQKL